MKSYLSLASVTFLACGLFVQASPGQDGGFQLKNRSVFTPAAVHNPFWPIGWSPSRAGAEPEPTGFALKPDDFAITSILLNEPAMAVINGKAYSEGQLFVVNAGGVKVPVRVQAIGDGRVVLRYHGIDVVCQLRRSDPVSHAAEAIHVQESAMDSTITIPR